MERENTASSESQVFVWAVCKEGSSRLGKFMKPAKHKKSKYRYKCLSFNGTARWAAIWVTAKTWFYGGYSILIFVVRGSSVWCEQQPQLQITEIATF